MTLVVVMVVLVVTSDGVNYQKEVVVVMVVDLVIAVIDLAHLVS